MSEYSRRMRPTRDIATLLTLTAAGQAYAVDKCGTAVVIGG